MDESLCSEKTCSSLTSPLPLWIIEYAWRERMEEVLEVLGPPLWLEGDWGCLSLEDSCSIRVAAAEAWMVLRARDIRHFERVMEFLDVTHTLLPQLVTPIKHMKIMFGLKTLVIMWMFRDDQSMDSITDKITRFFPDNLPQYHRSSHRHTALMQRSHQDFRSFAQSLARNPDMRKAYIRDLMEEQYGERYTLKLEERLSHYLEELDKALPQPTHIDQILKEPCPLGDREELLQQLLTCNTMSQPAALKRLLRCAIAAHSERGDAKQQKDAEANIPVIEPFCIALRSHQARSEEEKQLQVCTQGSWPSGDKRPVTLLKSSEKIHLDRQVMLKQKPDMMPATSYAAVDPCVDPQRPEPTLAAEQKKDMEVTTEHLCSRHGKKMKSILLECSEELKVQGRDTPLAHSDCTPPSPLAPHLQSTPQRLTHSSASLLQDSSSTNISLSLHSDSSSTNISGSEIQLGSSSQPSSLVSPVQQNTCRTSSVHQLNSSSERVLPSPSPSHLQQITSSPESLVQHSISHISSPSLIASSPVQQESSPSIFSVQPPLSKILPSAPNPLNLPATHITIGSTHDISPSQTAPSSALMEPSPPVISLQSPLSQTSYSGSSRIPVNPITVGKAQDISPSTSVQQESSSPASSSHQLGLSSNLVSLTAPTTCSSCEPVQATTSQDVDVVCEASSGLGCKLKLSLETQSFLLLCKWLQPQVLLCRLNQKECGLTTRLEVATSQSSEEEEVDGEREENQSFDVNVLYSDSESDGQDSDDPDYVPSKRFKAWIDRNCYA